jgi:hypothetical protein
MDSAQGETTAKVRCPCCRYKSLPANPIYEICQVCLWQDDGQDDSDADAVRGGPNYDLSLTAARENFKLYGACNLSRVHRARKPRSEEF